MNVQEINAWIDELLGVVADAFESGEEIPDDILGLVADAIEDAEREIEELEQVPVEAPGAELLWVLSGGNPQAFIHYLETVPDPVLNSLARNQPAVISLVERFMRQINIPQGDVSEGIPRARLQSSNIYGFQYDPSSQRLIVKFQGDNGLGDGPVYAYEGVQPAIYKIFQAGAVPAKTTGSNKWGKWWVGKNPSLGAAMHSLIKLGGYPYQKVA